MNNINKILVVAWMLVFMGFALYGYNTISGNVVKGSQYDGLAKHLTSMDVKMYGTDWCTYCNKQKDLFGSSFKYVDYVNCDKNPQECMNAGVTGYPTWSIGGQNYPGVQPLQVLAQLTNYEE